MSNTPTDSLNFTTNIYTDFVYRITLVNDWTHQYIWNDCALDVVNEREYGVLSPYSR
jgi:hypothetical protein